MDYVHYRSNNNFRIFFFLGVTFFRLMKDWSILLYFILFYTIRILSTYSKISQKSLFLRTCRVWFGFGKGLLCGRAYFHSVSIRSVSPVRRAVTVTGSPLTPQPFQGFQLWNQNIKIPNLRCLLWLRQCLRPDNWHSK